MNTTKKPSLEKEYEAISKLISFYDWNVSLSYEPAQESNSLVAKIDIKNNEQTKMFHGCITRRILEVLNETQNWYIKANPDNTLTMHIYKVGV